MISKNKAGHSSTHWTVSSLLFSRRIYCCTQSTYLTSLLCTEDRFKTTVRKEAFRQLCSYVNIYNEHIVIRHARDSRCLIKISVQCFPADVVNYFNSYAMNVWLSNIYTFVKVNVKNSVPDPDPNPDPDPHVFGPPRSGSTSQRYGSGSCSGSGSGSFYHHAKIVRKTLIPTFLWLFLTFYL